MRHCRHCLTAPCRRGTVGICTKSTKLLDLVVRDKLAVASFSSEIKDDFHGGSLIEAYLVEAIVNTLTEFPEIESVQILVEGEAVESIGGHIYIRNPLRRKD